MQWCEKKNGLVRKLLNKLPIYKVGCGTEYEINLILKLYRAEFLPKVKRL